MAIQLTGEERQALSFESSDTTALLRAVGDIDALRGALGEREDGGPPCSSLTRALLRSAGAANRPRAPAKTTWRRERSGKGTCGIVVRARVLVTWGLVPLRRLPGRCFPH